MQSGGTSTERCRDEYAELELRLMFLKERRKPMNLEKKTRKRRSIRQSKDTRRQV